MVVRRTRPLSLAPLLILLLLLVSAADVSGMVPSRRNEYTRRAKAMFAHGFHGYMEHAFPMDELNPIKCTGRGPDRQNPGNWGINDVLGNFSVTLVDSLDAIYTVLDRAEFEHAVRLVIEHVSFDQDSRVQVFEVTIRMMGGLLSGHLIAAGEVDGIRMKGYNDELLHLAKDLGLRLLPAFETGSGLPFPRVNLRTGVLEYEVHDTCTAGAGTLLLEFGVLSRLLKAPQYEIFEKVSRHALEFLWSRRSVLDLLGNTIDIDSGVWIQKMSGIGAGADSFYEYLMKAHVLFGDSEYYAMFEKAYNAVMTHNRIGEGFLYQNVDMDSGMQATNWVDSLSAFWPGLQVLVGDLNNAVKGHFTYFSIWQKYRAFPERFDYVQKNINIAHYPLRPELIESTYFLYMATKNPYYLEVGAVILEDLERQTKTSCGFGSMQSVASNVLEERMESFFLSETLKYLYLLFDEENVFNRLHSNFVFTTEGHVLPLPRNQSLARSGGLKLAPLICPKYTPPSPVYAYFGLGAPTSWLPVSIPDLVHINRLVGNPDYLSYDLLFKGDGRAPTCVANHTRIVASALFDNIVQESEVMLAAPPGSLEHSLNPIVTPTPDGYRLSTLNNVKLKIRLDQGGSSFSIASFFVNGHQYVVSDPVRSVKVMQNGIGFLLNQPVSPTSSNAPQAKRKGEANLRVQTKSIAAFGDTWVDYPVFSSSFSRSLESKEVLELQLTPLYSLSGTKTLVAGCKSYTQEQANQTRGKMVVVVRGDCSFEEKAIHALNAGAAAVGVVNVDNHILGMVGSGGLREPLGIPVVLLQKNTWDRVQVEVGGVESLLPVKLMALDTLEEEIITGLQLQYGNRPLSNLMIVAMVQVEGN